ncbi:uncharacterized protein BO87DRAFT_391483 [Aspergillus neoniger CBS 115656]|uniref:Uncharacterized protein n=1 Tax=Aspergillus neoniger (strain CBS 115656) TaxID=1448310 RepID=A0A318Y529_ASPNB|nr:hypothetical protein BO87DRAFT_391483 [Aspergillus neoniger CBS 115656]PYH28904.1 hypothetical protein BO87DRAFT_391483 [Aspergillus neoniger CBS 115656]
MSAIVFTMTKVMLSEAQSQTLLMPTHHFTIAVHAFGLEGCGGRGDFWGWGDEPPPAHHTTAIATATSADPLPNPSTTSTSDGASHKVLQELFGVLRRYEDFKSAKVLVVGKACISHHLKDRSLEKIEILVNTKLPPVTLRGDLIFDQSGYFSMSNMSNADGCSFYMKVEDSNLIPCTLDTVSPRQLSPTARDLKLQICYQAFGKVHQLQYVPREAIPFADLPSVILMEVLLPSETKTIIKSSQVWNLAKRLDPQFRWEDGQRNALEAKLTRLIDLGGKDEMRTREEWRAALHLHIDELADGVEDESMDGEDDLADGVEDEPLVNNPNTLSSNLPPSYVMPWRSWCVGVGVMAFIIVLYFLFLRETQAPEKRHNTWTKWVFVIMTHFLL